MTIRLASGWTEMACYGLISHSLIFKLYSDRTYLSSFEDSDLLHGTNALGISVK